MFEAIKKLWNRAPVEYRILELPASLQPSLTDKEYRDVVGTLAAHPGFIALTQRQAQQAAALKATLHQKRHADLRTVDFLQSGIYWAEWYANEVRRTTMKVPERRSREMAPDDLQVIRQIESQFEKIG